MALFACATLYAMMVCKLLWCVGRPPLQALYWTRPTTTSGMASPSLLSSPWAISVRALLFRRVWLVQFAARWIPCRASYRVGGCGGQRPATRDLTTSSRRSLPPAVWNAAPTEPGPDVDARVFCMFYRCQCMG